MKKLSFALILAFFSLAPRTLRADEADEMRRAHFIAETYARFFFEEERGRRPRGDFLTFAMKAAGEPQGDVKLWEASLHEFTETIMQSFLIGTALEFRSETSLAASLGISEQLARFIIINNQLNIDPADPRTEIDSPYFLENFQQLGAYIYAQDHADRIEYYRSHIRQKSVPEMAQHWGIKESDVYKEVWQLDIGFEEVWRTPLPEATLDSLRNRYSIPKSVNNVLDLAALELIPTEDLLQEASNLGVGRTALEFILHHTGVRNKGVTWSDEETVLLKHYFEDGLSRFEIAELLRGRHGYFYRTEESVSGKLTDLFEKNELSKRRETEGSIAGDIDRPGFKGLRRGGHFDRNLLRRFLLARFYETPENIAAELGCTVATVTRWQEKLRIFPLNREAATSHRSTPKKAFELSPEARSKHGNQRVAVAAWIDHYLKTGEYLSLDQLGNVLGFRAKGRALTNPASRSFSFVDTAEYVTVLDQAIENKATELGTAPGDHTEAIQRLRLFSVFRVPSVVVNAEIQVRLRSVLDLKRPKAGQQFLDHLIDEIVNNKRFPSLTKNQFGYVPSQINAKSHYKKDGRSGHLRIFEDHESFLSSFLTELENREKLLTDEDLFRTIAAGPFGEGRHVFSKWLELEDSAGLAVLLALHRARHRDFMARYILEAISAKNIPLTLQSLDEHLGIASTALFSGAETSISLFDNWFDLYLEVAERAARQGKFVNILHLYVRNMDPARFAKAKQDQEPALLQKLKEEILQLCMKEKAFPSFTALIYAQSPVLQTYYGSLWERQPPYQVFSDQDHFRRWLIDVLKKEIDSFSEADTRPNGRELKGVLEKGVIQLSKFDLSPDERKKKNQEKALSFWLQYFYEDKFLSITELAEKMDLPKQSLISPSSVHFAFSDAAEFLDVLNRRIQELRANPESKDNNTLRKLRDFSVFRVPVKTTAKESFTNLKNIYDQQRSASLQAFILAFTERFIEDGLFQEIESLFPEYSSAQVRGSNLFSKGKTSEHRRLTDNPTEFVQKFLAFLELEEKKMSSDQLLKVVVQGPFLLGRRIFSGWADFDDPNLQKELEVHKKRHREIILDFLTDKISRGEIDLNISQINKLFDFGERTLFQDNLKGGLFVDAFDFLSSIIDRAERKGSKIFLLHANIAFTRDQERFAPLVEKQRADILATLRQELIEKTLTIGSVLSSKLISSEKSTLLGSSYAMLWLRNPPLRIFQSQRDFVTWYHEQLIQELERLRQEDSSQGSAYARLRLILSDCSVLRGRLESVE